MDLLISPHPLAGNLAAIPSKSMAHRLLICAALSDGITDLVCPATSQDIDATIASLKALGAPAMRTRQGFRMVPLAKGGVRKGATLDVGESGSTLRFLLPIVAALGKGGSFLGHGRLAERPLKPLDEQLERHGCKLSARGSFPLDVTGKLRPGRFELPGNVSSQFISGLLMAAPLLDGATQILVSEPVESRAYVQLTIDALASFGVQVHESRIVEGDRSFRSYELPAEARYVSPGLCTVEGDWSNAAIWLAAGALGPDPITVTGLNLQSHQGDRGILAALALLGARVGRQAGAVSVKRERPHGYTFDVSGIPDLVPSLASAATIAPGTTCLQNASRLRLKESDRLESIGTTINRLGGRTQVKGDDLIIEGVEQLRGGEVDGAGDHRIAMMAAVCAAYAAGPSLIHGAECVAKSYPSFLDDFHALGGIAHEAEV